MTNVIPHLPGTNPKHHSRQAARALLAMLPAGTELVLDERPLDRAGVSTISSKVSRINSSGEFRARVERTNDLIRAYVALPNSETTEETPIAQTTTQARARRRRSGRLGRPALDVQTALQRVLDANGASVKVTNRSVREDQLEEARRQYNAKRTALLSAARQAGVRVTTSIRVSGKTIWMTARLVKN